jgi:hypothetical protein
LTPWTRLNSEREPGTFKSIELHEPQRELGVVALLAQLLSVEPTLFPFKVLDWNNASGFDLLARDVSELPLDDAAKFYVECKQLLTGSFNHSLNNVRYIVCWDSDLENDAVVTAVGGDTRDNRAGVFEPLVGSPPRG